MYKVFEFDEFTGIQLEDELNKYAKDGYIATFTEVKYVRGKLSGVCIMHRFDEEPVSETNYIGFNSTLPPL